MKIAYVCPRYSPLIGGVETHVARLAARMAAAGCTVEVLTQSSDRTLPAVSVSDGVTVRRFAVPLPSRDYAVAPGLWTYLPRHSRRYDVVHAHNYHAVSSLAPAVARCRALVFTPHYHGTGHTPLAKALHAPYRLAGAAIFAASRRVICVSEAEAALVRRHFPRASSRLTVIPNGVDVAELRAAAPYDVGRTVVLSAGRLDGYKRVDLIIRALAHLDDSFALRVAGDGPARAALEALAARLGLGQRVEFLGRVDDDALRRWFRTARVFASMSEHEAFGITVLEALAAGADVVASDIPSYREIARSHGGVALLPPGAAPERLARAIERAALPPRDGRAAPPILSWDDVAAETLRLYRAVAAPMRRG